MNYYSWNLVQTFTEIPTRLSRELQPWILVSDSESTLPCYYGTLTLKNLRFFSHIGWNSSIKISIDIFLSKMRFLNQILYVQCIISVPSWRKISQYNSASCWFLFLQKSLIGRFWAISKMLKSKNSEKSIFLNFHNYNIFHFNKITKSFT